METITLDRAPQSAADAVAAGLEAAIIQHVQQTQLLLQSNQEDAVWDSHTNKGYALYEQVEALPNTPDYLPLRARAVGACADDTDDLANLNLNELGASAHGLTGLILRQILSCLMDQRTCPVDIAPFVTPFADAAEPTAHADQSILDAFAARRREFEESYDSGMTQEETDAYFDRVDAFEAVIQDTAATTFAGVVVKLRVAFQHQTGELWSDRAIMDPTHPIFVAGLASADSFTRQAWAAIENLARLGGVDLATQGLADVPPSPFEALRREYADLNRQVNTEPDIEDDPAFLAACGRSSDIERAMALDPAVTMADAQAKLRFIVDLGEFGVTLDGEEATAIVKDAARFLAGGEA